jgi:hypothetical protein
LFLKQGMANFALAGLELSIFLFPKQLGITGMHLSMQPA